jgi:hypothetical protein
MILYVNGDSHSYGTGVDSIKTFAYHVANKFKLDLINQSKIGASNQHIIRTTYEYLKTNTPDLVLIGWTTWEREEWVHQEKYYDVNSSGHDGLPAELENRYKVWVTEQTSDTLDFKSQHWHTEIYNLHVDLQKKNIPHLFFNCMYNFFKIGNHIDWEHNFVEPYKNNYSYYWYLKNLGYITDNWYHYKEDGHYAWAKLLIEYIENHDIICKR